MSARLPRDLHPVAWWLWAIGLAVAASLTTNPYLLLLLVGTATLTVLARRGDQPWSRSFRLYLWLGLLVVVVRVVFRVLVGSGYPGTVVLDLPAWSLPLPEPVLAITFLGPVTLESLLGGLYDGMRLAAIIVCVGAANALANPKRLLRSVPPALYEIGTALVVAVSVLPQLADSVRRVRAAQALRAGDPASRGRVRGLRRIVVPVLEDAFERSLALAAGMDTRGYGRAGSATPGQRRTTGALMLSGLLGVCVGTYALLDQTGAVSRPVGRGFLLGGLLLAAGGLVSAGRRVERTRYRPDRWRWPEVVVAVSGVAVAVAGVALARGIEVDGRFLLDPQVAVAYPDLSAVPPVTLLALVGPLLGLVAALAAPPPVLAARPDPVALRRREPAVAA
ncbi:Energy-coupling factor transporter transmembrane protein EcfT [Nocardioides aquaticus]|uniref:Energy-coupling factor transporter transmembrane protein EcfT n=1 Tax=Nocardioides aquaticus TaxID=160826 RepID=A0ABX8EKC8_9ACTN|nr:energy-coupling factor transporter transmembrane component T [Nocardioides aquaticus]QVT80931.1 Energy-coupling factor transporter transmembrane protein EcfT [Nocardioides aquaticus]